MEALDQIEAAVADLVRTPYPSDAEAADWAGRLAKISRDVNEYKRGLLSEMSGPVSGSTYRVVESNSAERSYNTASILHRFAEQAWGLIDLVQAGAVRLDWQWTKLQAAAREAKVDLLITHRELAEDGDIDAPMVGEIWKTRQSVEGVK